jgi:hypothetical protein
MPVAQNNNKVDGSIHIGSVLDKDHEEDQERGSGGYEN